VVIRAAEFSPAAVPVEEGLDHHIKSNRGAPNNEVRQFTIQRLIWEWQLDYCHAD